jgi:hypothetical protein
MKYLISSFVAFGWLASGLLAQIPAITEPIGPKRLAQAHAYATNAEALAKGGAMLPHKQLVDASEKLSDSKLRHEIKVMADLVKFKFGSALLDSVQNNILAHIRMARHQLTNDKVERSLDDMQKTVRKHRKKEKKFNSTADLHDQIEAIHAVLRAP